MKAKLWGDWSAKTLTVAMVCGVALVVSLFFPWAERRVTLGEQPQLTAWEAAGVAPVILLLLGLAAIVVVLLGLFGRLSLAGLLLGLIGVAAFVVVFVAPLLNDAAQDFGSFWLLALFASVGLVVAGTASYGIRAGWGQEEGEGE